MRPAEDAEQEVSKTHSPGSGRITPLAYNIKKAARILSISRSKLYDLVASGQLPAKKCGSRTLIRSDDIDVFLRNLPSLPAKGPQNGGSDR
jgi:excisionase family DNA binding protein